MESKVPKNLWVSEQNGMGFIVTETLFSEPAIEFYSSLIIWKLFKGGLRPSLLALEKQAAMSSTDAQQGRVLPTATWSWIEHLSFWGDCTPGTSLITDSCNPVWRHQPSSTGTHDPSQLSDDKYTLFQMYIYV